MASNAGPSVAASTLPLPALRPTSDGLDLAEMRKGLELVKGCGVDLVDLTDTWLPLSEISESDIHKLKSTLDELDLAACGVSVVRHSVIDPIQSVRNVEHTKRAIGLALELGAPVVSIGFHEALPPEARAVPFWALEAPLGRRKDPVAIVRDLARIADAKGVAIALELYEGGPLGSGRLAVDMVRQIGATNVGINLDVGNLYRSPLSAPETWLECVETSLPFTNFWHVKNYRRIYEHPTGRMVGSIATTLSEGDIDYRRCMAAASAADYRGPIIVEHYGGDGIAAQRSGVAYLLELLGDR